MFLSLRNSITNHSYTYRKTLICSGHNRGDTNRGEAHIAAAISMASADCRHCSTEQLIDLALASAHTRLRERCDRAKVLAVLEDKHAAYDAHGLHSLLMRKYVMVEEELESTDTAPSTFLASLWMLVQPAESLAAEDDAGGASSSTPQQPAETLPSQPQMHRVSKQSSIGSFFGSGSVKYFERLPSGGRVLATVEQMSEEQLRAMPTATAGLCAMSCGLSFTHAPAKVAHEKVCKGGTNTTTNGRCRRRRRRRSRRCRHGWRFD